MIDKLNSIRQVYLSQWGRSASSECDSMYKWNEKILIVEFDKIDEKHVQTGTPLLIPYRVIIHAYHYRVQQVMEIRNRYLWEVILCSQSL